MNLDQFLGIRQQYTGRLKEIWGQLTRNKTLTIAGRRDQLIGKLQERHGYREANELQLSKPARARKLDASVNRAFEDLKQSIE